MQNTKTVAIKGAQVDHVIHLILEGQPLREAVKAAGLTPQAFNNHLQSDKQAALSYNRALEIMADLLAGEVVHLADGDGDPAKVRNQMQARQWLSSKLYARRYGERIDLNVTQTLDISGTLAEARARLLPVRDQRPAIDADYTIDTDVLGDRFGDKVSINTDGIVPDIFK